MNVNFFYAWSRKRGKTRFLSGNFSLPRVLGGLAGLLLPVDRGGR